MLLELVRERELLNMSQREAAYLMGVCPSTYFKYEQVKKIGKKQLKCLREFVQYRECFELTELPDIHLIKIDENLCQVLIGTGEFDMEIGELYDYFIFRPLVLRYTKVLLPRMKHVLWREEHLPSLLARMEK